MAETRSATNTYVSCEQMGCMGRRRSPGCSLQTNSLMNFNPQCSLPARNSCEKTPDKKTGRGAATTGPQLAQLVWWCVWSPRSPSRDRLVGEAAGTTTCFPSPTRGNSQGTVEEGSQTWNKSSGLCSSELLHHSARDHRCLSVQEIWLFSFCLHVAMPLARKSNPFWSKTSEWVSQKSYTVLWTALACLCIIPHPPCKYVLL